MTQGTCFFPSFLGIRCDGQLPCQQCKNATLTCKRDHVPKKRGPKRGHGRVINELRARELALRDSNNSACNSDGDTEADAYVSSMSYASVPVPVPIPTGTATTAMTMHSNTTTSLTSPRSLSSSSGFVPWGTTPASLSLSSSAPPPPRMTRELRRTPFTTRAFRPNSRSYLHLVPQCVDLYYRHVYPIMPLLYMPSIRAAVSRPGGMESTERNLIYALCALTAFHMSGKSLSSPTMGAAVPAPAPSWEAVGRFFLDECIAARQGYDFLEDVSLGAAVSSFWLSTSFFEISQSRKSWYYLREALNLALDLGLHDDASYLGLAPEDALCRQRVFWILFITERSFAILRNKPLTLRRTPRLPARGHAYEDPEIHAGFIKLVRSYMPLDENFVNAWNDGSDPSVSAATYLHLQEILAQPLDFLGRARKRKGSSSSSAATATAAALNAAGTTMNGGGAGAAGAAEETEPTAIQKADLLMTQQWLRLIVWQSSLQQQLLSTVAPHECMTFSFPLSIARDTVAALQPLPSHAIEVHGMGIFEKLFEIGACCVQILGAYDSGGVGASSPHHFQPQHHQYHRPFGGGGAGGSSGSSSAMMMMVDRADVATGMDHLRGDLSLLTQGGRAGIHTDPLEFFVKMLSASPNSRTQFAEKLIMLASESPGSMRTALSPAPSTSTTSSTRTEEPLGTSGSGGGVLGEVSDDIDNNNNVAQDENTFVLKTELPAENTGNGSGSSSMEGIKEVPGWGAHAGGTTTSSLSINTELGMMGGGTTTTSISRFSDLTGNGEDYGIGTTSPNHFGGRGGGPWSAPVGGAFFGEMEMAAHEGVVDDDDEMANVPRTQPGGFSNGMLGVW